MIFIMHVIVTRVNGFISSSINMSCTLFLLAGEDNSAKIVVITECQSRKFHFVAKGLFCSCVVIASAGWFFPFVPLTLFCSRYSVAQLSFTWSLSIHGLVKLGKTARLKAIFSSLHLFTV